MKKFITRAAFEFTIMCILLILVRLAVFEKVDFAIIESLKGATSQQSNSISKAYFERFEREKAELQMRADLLASGKITLEEAIDTISAIEGHFRGIIFSDRQIERMSDEQNDRIPAEIQSQLPMDRQAVNYFSGFGLVFTVPFVYQNQPCLFFEVFSDNATQQVFKVSSFNGKSTLILSQGEDWIFLDEGAYPQIARSEVQDFLPVLNQLKTDAIGNMPNTYYAENPEYAFFLFTTYISQQDNIKFSGYVEWDDLVGAIDYIYTLLDLLFLALAFSALLLCAYLFRKRQAEELAQQSIIADSANKAKSQFLSNMSHEIRTPINAIIGMDEMILRESTEQSILEYAQNLRHAATNLLQLINDILDFSKIEAGKMEIIPAEYHVSSLLNDLINMIQKRAENKGLRLEVEAAPQIPAVLFGDEVRIRQVITNLLTNAVKYTEKGTVTLRLNSIPKGDNFIYLCISVSDTGIGIKKEDIDKLYTAFERIEEKRNRNIEGTGLGMNITNKLLGLMGAKLSVDSVYSQGSTFSFQILQQVLNPTPIGDFRNFLTHAQTKIVYRASFIAPTANILVVDDTPMNLTVFKGLLKQTNINIDTAQSGADCLALATKKSYDIIFIDHMMPGMDGIDTLHALSNLSDNLNKNTPTVCLTANAITGAREQYIAAGFNDYLTKPINSDKLEDLIVKYLPPEKVQSAENQPQTDNDKPPTTLPDWLLNVQGISVGYGIEHCGGEEAYLDVLEVFANSIISGSEEINLYYNSEDWKNYTTKVHALKSTAKVIGAAELSERAKRLEDAGNSGYIDEIKLNHAALMNLYRSYLEKLKPLIKAEEDNSEKPMLDEKTIVEAFETMKEFAARFDYDNMQYIFQTLEEYSLTETYKERYKKIKEATEKLDWERVIRELEEVK